MPNIPHQRNASASLAADYEERQKDPLSSLANGFENARKANQKSPLGGMNSYSSSFHSQSAPALPNLRGVHPLDFDKFNRPQALSLREKASVKFAKKQVKPPTSNPYQHEMPKEIFQKEAKRMQNAMAKHAGKDETNNISFAE